MNGTRSYRSSMQRFPLPTLQTIVTRYRTPLLFGIVALTLVVVAAVFATEEQRTLYVFPTGVAGDGWTHELRALEQELSPNATYGDFNQDNSAFVRYDSEGARSVAPGSWPIEREQETEPEEFKPVSEPSQPEAVEGSASASETEVGTKPEVDATEQDDTATPAVGEPATVEVPNLPDETEAPVQESLPQALEDRTPLDSLRAAVAYLLGSGAFAEEGEGENEPETPTTGDDASPMGTSDTGAGQALSDSEASTDHTEEHAHTDTSSHDELPEPARTSGEQAQTSAGTNTSGVEDVRMCTVLDVPCHTLRFAGFDIGSILSNHKVKEYRLNLSFAAKSEGESFTDDKVFVRYFYRGRWHVAGEIAIVGERSNAENGGHWSFALPNLLTWDALKDLEVELEYVRQGTAATRLFVDALWIDTTYELGPGGGELPNLANVAHELAVLEDSRRPDLLIVDGERIDLPYADPEVAGDLVLRTDAETYHGLTSSRIHVAVTNRGKKATTAKLRARIGSEADILGIWERTRYLEEQAISRFSEVAYFCNEGWRLDTQQRFEDLITAAPDPELSDEALTGDEVSGHEAGQNEEPEPSVEEDELPTIALSSTYSCRSTRQIESCSSFNADRTNCIVGNERVRTDVESTAVETWAPLAARERLYRPVRSGILSFFGFREAAEGSVEDLLRRSRESEAPITIQPGETRFFAVDVSYPVERKGDLRIELSSGRTAAARTIRWESAYTYRLPVTLVPRENEEHDADVPVLYEATIDDAADQLFELALLDGQDVRFYDAEQARELPVLGLEYRYTDRFARYGLELSSMPEATTTIYAYFGTTNVRQEKRKEAPTPTDEPIPYLYAEGDEGAVFSFTTDTGENHILQSGDEAVALTPRVPRSLFVGTGELKAQGPFALTLDPLDFQERGNGPRLSFLPDTQVTETPLPDGRVRYDVARYRLRETQTMIGDLEALPAPRLLVDGQSEGQVDRSLRKLRTPQFHVFEEELRDFRLGEEVAFALRYEPQRNRAVRAALGLFRDELDTVRSVMLRKEGVPLQDARFSVAREGDDLWRVELGELPRAMSPGLYELELVVDEAGTEYVDRFEFYWGVLAMNTNKSVYRAGEEFLITIAALSDTGNTLCDADLALTVRGPDGTFSEVPVTPSGACNGNNVTDMPDYTARFTPTELGEYTLLLAHYDPYGALWRAVMDTVSVEVETPYVLERTGPTRIFPAAPYDMTIRVSTNTGFSGSLTEVLPKGFEVLRTNGTTVRENETSVMVEWELDLAPGEVYAATYRFDAPDVSPYLYLLGPAFLRSDEATDFTELRSWQVASDEVGQVLILWDGGAAPTGWTCISCTSGNDLFERFFRGSTTYGGPYGTATHSHSASYAADPTTVAGDSNSNNGGATAATIGHTHTVDSSNITTVSHLPPYRQLRVLRHDSAGTPAQLPTGAIVIFKEAVPSGWTRYSLQDGRYVRGASTVGSADGSSTHTHTVSGTLSTPNGTTRASGSGVNISTNTHTHTFSTTTVPQEHEPPFIEVVLGKLDAAAAPPAGMVAMWNNELPIGWNSVSGSGGDFEGRFIRASTTYGATGGALTHTHANISNIVSSNQSAVGSRTTTGTASAPAHTHMVYATNFSTVSNLPPYMDVVFAEYLGASAVFTQSAFSFYENVNAQTPTTPWPKDDTNDLAENEPVTSDDVRVRSGDRIRLRLSVEVLNADTVAGDHAFALEYGTGADCSAITTWYEVGDTSSTTPWRGYNNGSVSDGGTLADLLLASSTVAGTYEEENPSAVTPNDASIGDFVEYDWVLEQNGAQGGTTYCFRMVLDDGTPLFSYEQYPSIYTDETPTVPVTYVPFDNEKTATSTAWFEFVSNDGEGQKIQYQIQISTSSTFATYVVDEVSSADTSTFRNRVVTGQKSPFNSGQRIRYTPTAGTLSSDTTYWWRVRARDPDGSIQWSTWATSSSVTVVNTAVPVDTWFQTTDAQFLRGTLSGVTASGNSVALSATPGSGTLTSPSISFASAQIGTIWGELSWNHTVPANSAISYQVLYFTSTSSWELIPNSDLSGNSTGFTSGPVNLNSLDTETYATIRIRANLTSTGGAPSLQDWTVTWGTRVNPPTLLSPFDNEKISTTTPTLRFTTTDPQDEDISYQIEWSTDATFTSGVITRTSDTDGGFANVTTPADTDPFNSGDLIQYTVPQGDVLADGTTYYVRVRAKDTAYSLWSSTYSFTVDTTVDVSTWHQTMAAQFETNTLSGLRTWGNSLSVASTTGNALIAYGEGTETKPRYRLWNSTTWSSEGQALDVGAPINWAVTRAGVTRDEYVLGVLTSGFNVRVQVYRNGAWGNAKTLTAGISNANKRGFDIAYESISGRAMVVTCDGDASPTYFIWDGTTWSDGATVTTTGNNCEWVRLASDPTSNTILLTTLEEGGGQYTSRAWNGSTWGAAQTWGGITEANEGIAMSFQAGGNSAVVAVSRVDGNPQGRMLWRTWTTSTATWGGVNDVTVGYLENGMLRADPNSNAMQLCFIDNDTQVETLPWSGSWGTQVQLDASAHGKNDRPVDCAYGTTTNQIVAVYSDTTTLRYRVWGGATWAAEASIAGGNRSATVQLTRTRDGKILGVFFNHTDGRYDFSWWNGGAWSTMQALETSPSVTGAPYKEPFMVAAQNPLIEGTVYSTPIVFTAGNGQKWDKVTWNDTTPGSTDILYSVQYWTGSAWTTVPNAALPGNEAGTTTSPIDLSNLSTATYGTLRLAATLTCAGGSCPSIHDWTLEWSSGANVSGTLQGSDRSTNISGSTVAVAVNGLLQSGKTGVTNGSGAWTISNVTIPADAVVTVFVDGAASDAQRAGGVFLYTDIGDVSGITLYENHLVLGSGATTTITNQHIGAYDNSVSSDSDVFFEVDGSNDLAACATGDCSAAQLFVRTTTTFRPDSANSGDVTANHITLRGTFVTDANTVTVNGSWHNSGTLTPGSGTVRFGATSGTRTIDSTGASAASFNALTIGVGASTAVWELASPLTVGGTLTLAQGSLSPGAHALSLSGNLSITAAGGFTKGTATTTFAGSGTHTWTDASAGADLGKVAVGGASGKQIQLGSSVGATDLTVASNNTLVLGANTLSLSGNLTNNGTLSAGSGTVRFTGTTPAPSYTIRMGSSSFHDLTFDGAGGLWGFLDSTITVDNNLTIQAGTVTLPNGTTTVAGNFANTGGVFQHNNGTVAFTNTAARTIQASTSPFHTLVFSGSGARSFVDAHATSSGNVRFTGGATTLPSGTFAVGASFSASGSGTFVANGGTARFYAGTAQTITTNGGALHAVRFDGSGGAWSMLDSAATTTGTVTIAQGSVTLPAVRLSVGGSFDASGGAFTAGSGEVRFVAAGAGKTVHAGSSSFASVAFDHPSAEWSLLAHATATGAWRIDRAGSFTAEPSTRLEVGGDFVNNATSSTWSGSTLALLGGSFTASEKTVATTTYGTLIVGPGTHVRMWKSSAATYEIDPAGSLYSQDHAGIRGNLYLWGGYERTSGTDHWSYATDFDGTDQSMSPRKVTVRFADQASARYNGAALSIVGTASATTTIERITGGSYGLSLQGGTLNASRFEIAGTDPLGLALWGSTTVTTLSDGFFELAAEGGSMMTVSSTTIDHNPALQVFRLGFATSSGIVSGYNVTATGTPISYWWFRDHYGNYDGEAYDNDPVAEPGALRWDDSGFTIAISGNAYAGEGVGGAASSCGTHNVRLVVNGTTPYTAACDSGTGAFSFPAVSFAGDATFVAYLDTNGGARGAVVSRTPQSTIEDLAIYEHRVIVRHEYTEPLTLTQMAAYDSDQDSDIPYDAEVGALTVAPETGLFVWSDKTFAPGGNVTLASGGSGATYDGTLRLGTNAVFTSAGTETHTIGGSWVADTDATFTAASSSVVFTATTSGKTIAPSSPFYDVTFSGSGGWTIASSTVVTNALAVNAGSVVGTANVTVENGALSGNGSVALTGGTVTLYSGGMFGGSTAWSFNNLTLGNGGMGTTSKSGAGSVAIAGVLTVSANHVLEAGSVPWTLSGSGAPLVVSGSFSAQTSTTTWTGTAATAVPALSYHNLVFAPTSGSPTFTLAAGTLNAQSLTVGNGTNAVTVEANTNDPLINVSGTVRIRPSATYSAASANDLRIGGSYLNEGVFTHNGGGVVMQGSTSGLSVTPGNSPFRHLTFNNASGGWTISGNATTTGNFTLMAANSFTQANGTTLEVQGVFTNEVGGGVTEWTGSTLYLNSGTSYTMNSKTSGGDSYAALRLGASTHVRAWDSAAMTYTIPSSASFYSQDHANVPGELYIWGNYTRASGADHWSYATDFDGTDITSTPRQAKVFLADQATTTLSGGSLSIVGGAGATTTMQNQGSGTYGLVVSGGTFTAQYFRIRNIRSQGLTFSGAPTVTQLADGDLELSIQGGSTMTVAGSVITANPAKTWQGISFATSSGVSGFNVTATGSTGSSWRFTPTLGNLYGESYDNDPSPDPDGNPGYLVWEDSVQAINVSGRVYSDEGTTVSGVCNGSTPVVKLVAKSLAATTETTVPCAAGTGLYEVSSINFFGGGTVTVYLTGTAVPAAQVVHDTVSSLSDVDLYERRIMLRSVGPDAIRISDLAVHDSGEDPDVPFIAATGSPSSLTLPANTKLIVMQDSAFAPHGNITLQSGAGTAWDGTLELKQNATLVASTTQAHTYIVGGDWLAGSGSTFTAGLSTVTFTATTSGKTIEQRSSAFNTVIFNGTSGAWTFTGANATTTDDLIVTNGSVTVGTSTLAVGGSLVNDGTLVAASTTITLSSAAAETVKFGGASVGSLRFTGSGTFMMTDTNATSTGSVLISAGAVHLPSGTFAVAHGFEKTGGSFSHSGTLRLYGDLAGQTLRFGGSTLRNLTIAGTGSWTIADTAATSTGSVTIQSGGLTAPSANFGVGGSFVNSGTFNANGGHLYLFATSTGQTVAVGGGILSNVTFAGSGGGWTVSESATTTGALRLRQGTNFTMASSTVLEVQGVFENLIGGSATDWTDSRLYLNSGTSYTINTKAAGGDAYAFLTLGADTDVRMWNSSGATTTVHASSSLYSMNHGGSPGLLHVYGEYVRTSGADYWSHATDFDGVALGGGARPVSVRVASSSSITLTGGTLSIVGTASATTSIEVLGTGAYSWSIQNGTFEATYFSVRNLTAAGLILAGTTNVNSLSYGDMELSAEGGTLISVASSVIDQNPTKLMSGNRFATGTGATMGINVKRTGNTSNYWYFQGHYGGLSGEAYDDDGGDACGAIRWADSTCLEVSQSAYRFRADNGGGGAPDSEWFSTDWDKRIRVNVQNQNGQTITNGVVRVEVPLQDGMRSDFADLRFTDTSGTNLLSYVIESYTAATATVWVKVPSVAANSISPIYAYYDYYDVTVPNGQSATSTFLFLDTFESTNLASRYTGNTNYFAASASFARQGSYGLGAAVGYAEEETTGGMYGTSTSISRGSTLRWYQYVDTGASEASEPCTLFGVQGSGQNYAACLDQSPGRVVIARNVSSRDESGTILASSTASWMTGWYTVEVDWLSGGNMIHMTVHDVNGTLVASASASDGTYSSGTVGYSFWYQYGGWDFVSARPYAAIDLTGTVVGLPQGRGGAPWLAAQNTSISQEQEATFRVRFAIENSGLEMTDQQIRLQYADKTGYGTCNAVPSVEYDDVPNAAGCGVNAICMTTTAHYNDGDPTELLLSTSANYRGIAGKLIESPSNQTTALTIGNERVIEVEYAIELTPNATSDSYCLRTSDGGVEFDSYPQIAEVTAKYGPQITNWRLNYDAPIALVEGTTRAVVATGTVADLNGFEDLVYATSTIYRSGVGSDCASDPNNCYQLTSLQCPFENCSGTTCQVTCTADLHYFAEPTDDGSAFEGESWQARLFILDSTGNEATSTSEGVDLLTLRAMSVISGSISYGTLGLAEDTGSSNAVATVQNTGNVGIDLTVEGTDMTAGSSVIPAGNQLFATSTFTYSSCVICSALSGSPSPLDLDLGKPTSTSSAVTDDIYWGVYIPSGVAGTAHYGVTEFYPIST